jgi:F0F1-type ATP synthase membrane subunit c/vacuolar-type H+-ATPase subunit K
MQTSLLNKKKRMIWLVLLAAQGVYVVVALFHPGFGGTSFADNHAFPIALALVSIVSCGMAHNFWRRASGAGLALHEITSRDPAKSFPLFLQAWVIDESIAIYGLIQALSGIPVMIWLPFSLAGALLLILHRPVESAA